MQTAYPHFSSLFILLSTPRLFFSAFKSWAHLSSPPAAQLPQPSESSLPPEVSQSYGLVNSLLFRIFFRREGSGNTSPHSITRTNRSALPAGPSRATHPACPVSPHPAGRGLTGNFACSSEIHSVFSLSVRWRTTHLCAPQEHPSKTIKSLLSLFLLK